MNRIFYLIMVLVLMSGCPATFNGLLKNESDHKIEVVPPSGTEFRWEIESGSREKVRWYQECITINGPNGIQYFTGWPIPDNVVSNGVFSSSFEVVYKSNNLFFVTKNRQLVPINQVARCAKE